MKKLLLIGITIVFTISCNNKQQPDNKENKDFDYITSFEKSNGFETATYDEVIDYYTNLAASYPTVKIDTIGATDAGKPLHVVWFNKNESFTKNAETISLLINNGIHPGESDGIDATMMLYRDLAQHKININPNIIIATIPIYNVGGSLNRNTGTRANQNGPKSYGFRGNARNFDLNRDFIKSDTKNAKTFAQIYHMIKPEVFIDNHVSNGADYQYTLTHLFTQHNKLGGPLGNYLHHKLMPNLTSNLEEKSLPITPYVNVWGNTPEAGWSQFMDYPRYSTGYTTLFNSLGMMVETHMLKPYKDRVNQTYELMESMIDIMGKDAQNIKNLYKDQIDFMYNQKTYALDWTVDSTQTTTLNFMGYEGSYIPSDVTGKPRLFYDRTKPFTKEVTYYNFFKPKKEVSIPKAYIIPQNFHDVITLLKANDVALTTIAKDTSINVSSYKIKNYKTRSNPFEGHYMHYNTSVTEEQATINFRKGDYIVYTQQESLRYLIATLEPEAPDSFFNWNYFDTILQQKEHFSPYVFEDTAKELLASDNNLRTEFENLKASNEDFANNWYAQLNWIYEHSIHYEKAHMQYPIYLLR